MLMQRTSLHGILIPIPVGIKYHSNIYMNHTSKLAMVVFAMALSIFTETLAQSNGQLNIPAALWEQHPEGIALALFLSTQDVQKKAIQVYIQNTSNTDKYLIVSGIDSGIQIYYIDATGAQVPLHNYSDNMLNRKSSLIKPGETLTRRILLTPDELVLIQTHPIKCNFIIHDPATEKYSKIESTPKMLASGP